MRVPRPEARRHAAGWSAACLVALAAGSARADAPAATVAAPPSFDIEAYDVDGAKLLTADEVERAVYPYLGPGRTPVDVEAARTALEKAYRAKGYQSVAVQVPRQSVADNIVRLHVVEAAVGRLRVVGSRYYSPERIRQEVPAFQEGQVPDITTAQAQLTDVNRQADRRVTPLLRAGAVPGTVDVDLNVADTLPLHASLELNNDHSLGTQPLRLIATGSYSNLWQLGHTVSFTYDVAPQDRSGTEVYAGSYLAPLWGTPWSLLLYGYDSNSDIAALGGSDVLGKGHAVGVRAIYQIPPVFDLSQSFSFGFDYKKFAEKIGFAGTTSGDIVEYYPANFTYNVARQGTVLGTRGSIGVTLGTRGAGSTTADFQTARFNATPDFFHFNLDVTQTEELGRGFEAAQRLTGQISDQPLVSSEEFAGGGLTSVRGYLQSEVVGDSGFTGGFELRSPSEAQWLSKTPWIGGHVDEARVYVFADGAIVRVLDPLADQAEQYRLASAGLGLRFVALKYLKGDLLGAVPLFRGVSTVPDRPQFTFSLKSDF